MAFSDPLMTDYAHVTSCLFEGVKEKHGSERERAGWVGFSGRREEGGKPKSSEAAKISLAKVFYY